MRLITIALLSLFVAFTSCNSSGAKDKSLVPNSVGNINALQIITPNDLWNGVVGEAIRNNFAAPTDGLPQDEPLFFNESNAARSFFGFCPKQSAFSVCGFKR
jgi:hypothetical protein